MKFGDPIMHYSKVNGGIINRDTQERMYKPKQYAPPTFYEVGGMPSLICG